MIPAKISEKPLWLGDAMGLWKLRHALNHNWSVSNIHCLLIHKECSLQQSDNDQNGEFNTSQPVLQVAQYAQVHINKAFMIFLENKNN